MAENLRQLNMFIPEDLHKKFRIKCIQDGTTIKSLIIEFVKNYVEEVNGQGKTDSPEDESGKKTD